MYIIKMNQNLQKILIRTDVSHPSVMSCNFFKFLSAVIVLNIEKLLSKDPHAKSGHFLHEAATEEKVPSFLTSSLYLFKTYDHVRLL